MEQPHHLLGCHGTCINSLLISFLNALHFSNLVHQAISLIKIIASGSSSSILLSRLKSVLDCYKNQEMCNKAADNYPHAFVFVS